MGFEDIFKRFHPKPRPTTPPEGFDLRSLSTNQPERNLMSLVTSISKHLLEVFNGLDLEIKNNITLDLSKKNKMGMSQDELNKRATLLIQRSVEFAALPNTGFTDDHIIKMEESLKTESPRKPH